MTTADRHRAITSALALAALALVAPASCRFFADVGAPCEVDAHCPTSEVCLAGRCLRDDGEARRDAGPVRDAGTTDGDDAGAPEDAGGPPDAGEPADAGAVDAGPDSGPGDAGPCADQSTACGLRRTDMNGDGCVDQRDRSLLLDAFGCVGIGLAADLDCDDTVGLSDLNMIASAFCTGSCYSCGRLDFDGSGCASSDDATAWATFPNEDARDVTCDGVTDVTDEQSVAGLIVDGGCPASCVCLYGKPSRDIAAPAGCVDVDDLFALDALAVEGNVAADLDRNGFVDVADRGVHFTSFVTGCPLDPGPQNGECAFGLPTRDLNGDFCVDAADRALLDANVQADARSSIYDMNRDCVIDRNDFASFDGWLTETCAAPTCITGLPNRDLDGSGCVDQQDVAAYEAAVASGSPDTSFDMDRDCEVNGSLAEGLAIQAWIGAGACAAESGACFAGVPTADVVADGCVDAADVAALSASIGAAPWDTRFDLNRDCTVDTDDLETLQAFFRAGCPSIQGDCILGIPSRDLNNDGCVNGSDLSRFNGATTAPGGTADPRHDFNLDCVVDPTVDFPSLSAFFGAGSCTGGPFCTLGCPTRDLDNSGCVDSLDANIFTSALTAGVRDSRFDFNGDCAVDGFDIDPFTAFIGFGVCP